ncbi:DUF2442 domain-containing protein [Rugamonas sp. DEMB1]|uniref:DUF2442 domain-containing protein n=1 Tax=Rugamonas sp. DEMB1 TaxID=3039386 RepID=UPI00244880DA|nr:DUF2442 domain-containing protein [Rugamonas sp. DEMB1]WGG50001.1 DUF2442 domain-containing protein [Rugamonas sp. DEMB1]
MIEPLALKLTFDQQAMWVHLADGRTLGVPLSFFPRLQRAKFEQLADYVISGGGTGLHWDALDEDISVQHLMYGYGDQTADRGGLARQA